MQFIQQQYGQTIWSIIADKAIQHTEFEIHPELIEPQTHTELLFPIHSLTGKNRFGEMMFEIFQSVNVRCGTDFEVDYLPRSEYIHFQQLQDIWLYFINRLENPNLSKRKNKNVVPFPKSH